MDMAPKGLSLQQYAFNSAFDRTLTRLLCLNPFDEITTSSVLYSRLL